MYNLSKQDLKALNKFIKLYPTWWYTIGVCDISRDFTAAPQGHSPEAKYITHDNKFNVGFMCDSSGTVADAIEQVLEDISYALDEAA